MRPAAVPAPSGVGVFNGRHVLAELGGIDAEVLDDEPFLRHAVEDALARAGATVGEVISKEFDPPGVTVLALLSESHASLHTYPLAGSAFVDVFTCGDRADPELAARLLAEALGARSIQTRTIQRGKQAPVAEPLAPGLTREWRVDEVIWTGRTDYQDVMIAATAQGVALFCDNDRQSTQLSQLVYHEALLVPALLLAERRDRVLVIGSSEGVVSQISVAAGARQVDHVDIDRECVRACARHLPYGYDLDELARAERGEGPVRMHYADGWQFVADAVRDGERYDIVLVDLPDESVRPAQHNRLYGVDYLTMCRSLLESGGVVVGQAGCPTLWRNDTLVGSLRRFNEVFATVAYYGSDEHEWAFLFGRADALPDTTGRMVEQLPVCRYRPESIDAEALRANAMPPYHVRHLRPAGGG